MAFIGRWARTFISRSPSAPRAFPTTGFRLFPQDEKVEEENWEWYKSASFYPVHIGEVFKSRYQAIGKLGYGSRSTVWLCRDLQYVLNTYQFDPVVSRKTNLHF